MVTLSIPDRIDRMSSKHPVSGCWIWTGRPSNAGYGQMTICGGDKPFKMLAHRASYEAYVGPIPDGFQLDHLCRNRLCVNPSHLEPVTNRENLMRSPIAPAAINAAKTHCPQGHPYAGDNLYITPSTGGRICRTCSANSRARRHAARQGVSA